MTTVKRIKSFNAFPGAQVYPSVNGLVAEPVNIALSWDIHVRFGDLRQDVMS